MSDQQPDEAEPPASSPQQPQLRRREGYARQTINDPTVHDPMVLTRDQAPTFNNAWMKNGESMPLVQRIGFMIFSLLCCQCGAFLISGAIENFREDNLIYLFFVAASLVMIVPGILGLRNVLRFPRRNSKDS